MTNPEELEDLERVCDELTAGRFNALDGHKIDKWLRQYLSILPLVSEMGDCYRIKPLEWTTNAYGDFYANSRACYKVEKTSADQIMWGYCWDEYYDEAQYECESYEEGKQKAEEHYQKRVKEFLTPTDNTTAIAKILGE